MQLCHSRTVAMCIIILAAGTMRSGRLMGDIANSSEIDLAKVPNRSQNASWAGDSLACVIDASQIEKIIVIESCSSATPQTLTALIIGILNRKPAIEKPPEAWRPQGAPTVEAVVALQQDELLQISVWKDWGRVTSTQGHGFFRWSSPSQPLAESAEGQALQSNEEIDRLARRLAVDLTFRPNLRKHRLWRAGTLSHVIRAARIKTIAVCRSTTKDSFEGDVTKVRRFIENGRALAADDRDWRRDPSFARASLIDALAIGMDDGLFRITIRGNEARLTSLEGHGYFEVGSPFDN